MRWRRPRLGESEPAYTGSVLLPVIEALVKDINKPGLVVRSDGGVPPRPVVMFGSIFYPDLEIAFFDTRSLAVEVKFVREVDGSGSITKALGQGLIYRAGGHPRAHVVVVDARPRSQLQEESLELPSGVTLHLVNPE